MFYQPSLVFTGIDSSTPYNKPLSGKYLKSFAHYTIKERLPVILTNVVDHLVRNKGQITKFQDSVEEDLKNCIGKISKLKNELQTNKMFIELPGDEEDTQQWNAYLQSQSVNSEKPCWFDSPWLYAECYMYKRLQSIFKDSSSQSLRGCDWFYWQKKEAFEKTLPSINTITGHIVPLLGCQKDKEMLSFILLMKVALWGNRCDLSISSGENLKNVANLDMYKALDEFLLHDDSILTYNLLFSKCRNQEVIIDYVLDNAGFELFCDLCFCDFLCTMSLSSKIRFHVKKYPWYVSDATKTDVKFLIQQLLEDGLEELAGRWNRYFKTETWVIYDENYWTMPFPFDEMAERDKALYEFLCQSTLVVFKGDLNYRKFLRDINWKPTERLEVARGKFSPTQILLLRTVKSDIICGLIPEKIKDSDLMWMRTGEFGVIQLC